MSFHGAVICKHGHVIKHSLQPGERYDRGCEECGQLTTSACESCGTPLRGKPRDYRVPGPLRPPNFCRTCLQPYSWTKWKAEELKHSITTLSEGVLSAEETDDLRKFADEVVSGDVTEPRIYSSVKLLVSRFGPAAKTIINGVVDVGTTFAAKVTVEAMKTHGL
jgi:hypothetical protein